MDLNDAIEVMGSYVHLPGQSDYSLLRRIAGTPGFSTSKELSPAAGLDKGVHFRPCEVLHLLSYVTRPRYQTDLHDVYAQWALLRYLGFFELVESRHSLPGLRVSEAGRRITGNQRRVTSEEMGIAFGALLGLHWFTQTGAAGVPMSVIDIDAALDDRYVFAAGARQAVRKVGPRRPDYLVIAHDTSMRSRYRIRMLECKGTRTPGYAVNQLARALGQLDGVAVGGRVPAGLAVSMITSNDQVSYLAIDPADEEEPSYEVTSDTIEQAGDFQLADDTADLSAIRLASASVSASWATLADFGGNLGALDRWAPTIMRRRLDRRTRERVTFETPNGTARGTSTTFTLDGVHLTVRHAIEAEIDRQLSQGSAESVSEAQGAFAERLTQSQELARPTDTRELYSATADGSIFSLSLG